MNCHRIATTSVQALFKPNETRYVCNTCKGVLVSTNRWAELPNTNFNSGLTFCQGTDQSPQPAI
jgi:hypothetical protein